LPLYESRCMYSADRLCVRRTRRPPGQNRTPRQRNHRLFRIIQSIQPMAGLKCCGSLAQTCSKPHGLGVELSSAVVVVQKITGWKELRVSFDANLGLIRTARRPRLDGVECSEGPGPGRAKWLNGVWVLLGWAHTDWPRHRGEPGSSPPPIGSAGAAGNSIPRSRNGLPEACLSHGIGARFKSPESAGQNQMAIPADPTVMDLCRSITSGYEPAALGRRGRR